MRRRFRDSSGSNERDGRRRKARDDIQGQQEISKTDYLKKGIKRCKYGDSASFGKDRGREQVGKQNQDLSPCKVN